MTNNATRNIAVGQASAPMLDEARTTTQSPRGLAPFLLIAFGFSWLTWWIGTAVGGTSSMMLTVIIGSFGPAIAAVAVTATAGGRAAVGALFRRYSPRRRGGFLPYGIAAVVFVMIAGSTLIPVLVDGVPINWGELAVKAAALPVNILLIALAGGGNEEIGWRGFALPRLQSTMSPLAANLVLGVIWAVWHAPLWAMAGTAQSALSFPVYVLLVTCYTVVFGFVFNASRGGLLAVVVAHTCVNVAAGLKVAAVGSVDEMSQVYLFGALAVILLVVTRGRLGLPHGRGENG